MTRDALDATRRAAAARTLALAEELLVEVYQATSGFPPEESAGLTAQVRRAALNLSTHLVRSGPRRSAREGLRSLGAACAAASELRHLLRLSVRLGCLAADVEQPLALRCGKLIRSLIVELDARASQEDVRAPRRKRLPHQPSWFIDPPGEREIVEEDPAP